jgi:hypothetical protein
MNDMPEARQRLAAEMENRRQELDLLWQDVADAGGTSVKTLYSVRTDPAAPVTPRTARKIETGLHWEPGSVQAVLDGGRARPSAAPAPSAVRSPAAEPSMPVTVERVVRALLPKLPPEHRDVITGITRLTDGEGNPLSDEKKLAMIEAWVSYGQQGQGEQAGLETPLPAVSFC